MSECIETLNGWGEHFWEFAWPMLWQSSLLIVVVFAFDLLLVRRIRASVRYALWMAVLIKLILPPALALPTGATWWLWRPHPLVEHPLVRNYTVSFGNTFPNTFSPPPTVPVALPPPELNVDTWVLFAVAAMGAGLLLWLAFRWLRVAGKVRCAATAPLELNNILEEVRHLAGLRRCPQLKLIDEAQSPAVYGLFRPVILLPRMLAGQLSGRQLRAVLLHEAAHLRRGDIWMNCAQTLLQIAYWWHPLLWFANARIRRLREEAVDDAVMLALRDGADAYVPTLLEVAKYAFRRPLASLGLVGILESRSALRQRVERLINFRPPRRAGITFLSLCGIFAFCAVALPMGQGPMTSADSFLSDADSSETMMTLHVNPDVFIRNIKARLSWTMERDTNDYNSMLFDILENEGVDCAPPRGFSFNSDTGEISTRNSPEQLDVFRRVIEALNRPDGKWDLPLTNRPMRKNILIQGEIFWMTGDHFEKLIAHAIYHPRENGAMPSWTADSAQLKAINQRIESMRLFPVQQPRIETTEGCIAELSVGNTTNSYRLKCDPYLDAGKIVLACQAGSMFASNGPSMTAYTVWNVTSKQPIDNGGGIVLCEPSPDGSSNFVVILQARIVVSARTVGAQNISREVAGTGFRGATDDWYSVSNRAAIYRKLNQIQMNVSYHDQPLSEVIHDLGWRLRELDTNKPVINFLFNPNAPKPVDASRINIDLSLNNASLLDVLNAICLVSDHPIKYSVEDYGIVFSVKGTDSPQYEMRTFKVDLDKLRLKLKSSVGNKDPMAGDISNGVGYNDPMVRNITKAVEQYFSTLGLVMVPPETVVYNERIGVLFVYATPQNLDVIERMVSQLNDSRADSPVSASENGISEQAKSALNQALTAEHKDAHMDLTPQDGAHPSQTSDYTNRMLSLGGPDFIHLDQFGPFQHATLSEVVDKLSMKDPSNIPILVTSKLLNGSQTLIDLPKLTDMALSDVLDAIVKGANQRIRYSVMDHFIVFSGFPQPEKLNDELFDPISGTKVSTSSDSIEPSDLGSQTFYVNSTAFFGNLDKKIGSFYPLNTPTSAINVASHLREFLAGQGVNLDPPKTLYYNDGLGLIYVHATPQDLDAIEKAMRVLAYAAPMAHIKARFIDLPQKFLSSAVTKSMFPGLTNGRVLPAPEFERFLREAKLQSGFEEVAEPEATTLSGRQTRMRATITREVVTNFTLEASAGAVVGSEFVPQTEQVETGPIFDVVPDLLSDDFTINVTAIATQIDFLGYSTSNGLVPNVATNAVGTGFQPVFQVRDAWMSRNLWDGQTLVLFPNSDAGWRHIRDEKGKRRIPEGIERATEEDGDKVLIVLTTATLIDATGNRIHSVGELPFAQKAVPAQLQ